MIGVFKRTIGVIFGFMFTVVVMFVVVGSVFKFFDEGSRHHAQAKSVITQQSAHPESFYTFDSVVRGK